MEQVEKGQVKSLIKALELVDILGTEIGDSVIVRIP